MKNIWRFFLVIFLFIIFLFVILTNGINIENLVLPKIKISQLYIKLDKKLIVSMDTLELDIQNNNNTSLSEINYWIDKLPILYTLFKSISIQNIIFDNKTLHFLYKNEIFFVDSDFLTIDSKIVSKDDDIKFKINQMILKDFKIELNGKLVVNLKNELLDFKGNFSTFNIDGKVDLKIDNQILYYRLDTKKFKTLKPFMDFLSKKIHIEPLISDWIYKKIVANEYQLHFLEGKFNLDTFDFYPNLMKAKATGKNAFIKFDKNAPHALVNELDVILENDNLIFNVKKAEYQDKDVTNTKVYIYHLMTKGAGIVIEINANTILDDSIHAVLHAFNIKVPITQTAGKTEANVKIDIKFLPFGVKSYSGYFKINDANISLNGLPIYSKNGFIKLDNGMVYLQNVNLKYDTLFDIYTSGDLNLTNGIYNSENIINSLHINFDTINLLHVNDFNTTATMHIENNKTSIYLDKFKTNLEFLTKNNKVTINDLSLIYPYSKLMKDFDIKDGKLNLETDNFTDYKIKANLKNMNLPLERYGKKIDKLELNITTNNKNLKVISKDKKLQLTKKDEIQLVIRDTNVIFDSSKHEKNIDIGKITVVGINSNIIDTNTSIKIPSRYFTYKLNENNLSFNSNLFKQTIFIKQTNNSLYLNSKNLTDIFVNNILDKKVFANGSFDLYIDGNNTKNLGGTFKANNTTIKGISFYNNLIAFIHTIPSLITFKNPGFNEDGYQIIDSFFDFTRVDDILTIDKLNINGKSTDITGSGTINLKTDELNVTLQISVLKNLSSIVSNIPIMNYIFLGKNGKMYTQVNIKGTLKKPIIITNVIQDTALSPLGIIKRTIETPFRIFKNNDSKK
jgi:hypothetical protein